VVGIDESVAPFEVEHEPFTATGVGVVTTGVLPPPPPVLGVVVTGVVGILPPPPVVTGVDAVGTVYERLRMVLATAV
jgi:hypothetical protein